MKHEKNFEMQKRAMLRIPGMTQLLSKSPDMFAPGVWPGYFSKAKGVEVWDLDGNQYAHSESHVKDYLNARIQEINIEK